MSSAMTHATTLCPPPLVHDLLLQGSPEQLALGKERYSLVHYCSAVLDSQWQLYFCNDFTFAFNLIEKY